MEGKKFSRKQKSELQTFSFYRNLTELSFKLILKKEGYIQSICMFMCVSVYIQLSNRCSDIGFCFRR